MKLKHFAAAALCAAAGVVAAPAMAAGVTKTITYDFTALPLTTTQIAMTLNIQQFDATLGILDGVEIAYDAGLTSTLSATNSTKLSKSVRGSVSATLTLTGPSGLALGQDSGQVFSGSSTVDAHTSTLTAVASGTKHFTTDVVLGSGSFSTFTGSGFVQSNLSIAATSNKSGDTGTITKLMTQAVGGGHVTYTYTIPTPVPEPETYGMLLLGMGVVAFAAKRKSRAA